MIEIDARPMTFVAEFGWEMKMEPVETLARSAEETADGQEEAVFRLRAVSQNREKTGVLYTAKQTFEFSLALPPELALPEGTVTYDGTANALRAGGIEIAVLEGMPENAQITEIEKTDAQNLSFTLLREQEELEEEMADMDLTIRVVRDGLTLTETFTGEAQAEPSVPAAAEENAVEENTAADSAVQGPAAEENAVAEPVIQGPAAEENAAEETVQSAATEQSAPEETENPAGEPVLRSRAPVCLPCPFWVRPGMGKKERAEMLRWRSSSLRSPA